jgi:hypothetical protein
LGIAASKFFVTVCAFPSWAWMGPAIEKTRAAQAAAMEVRIFMEFLLLPKGGLRSSLLPAGLPVRTEWISLAG